MNHRIVLHLVFLSIILAPFGVNAAECEDPKTSEEIAQCIGRDLRDADAKINQTYKELMGKLNESDKNVLRSAQRAWIKDRDSTCKLDTKESNREKWYQALLQDYPKTVCVTRYTRQRTTELDSMLAKLFPQKDEQQARPNPISPPPRNRAEPCRK